MMPGSCRLHCSLYPLSPVEADRAIAVIRQCWAAPHAVRRGNRQGAILLELTIEALLPENESAEALLDRISIALWQKIGRFVRIAHDFSIDTKPSGNVQLEEPDYIRLMRHT